jgi:hypothetical protein
MIIITIATVVAIGFIIISCVIFAIRYRRNRNANVIPTPGENDASSGRNANNMNRTNSYYAPSSPTSSIYEINGYLPSTPGNYYERDYINYSPSVPGKIYERNSISHLTSIHTVGGRGNNNNYLPSVPESIQEETGPTNILNSRINESIQSIQSTIQPMQALHINKPNYYNQYHNQYPY